MMHLLLPTNKGKPKRSRAATCAICGDYTSARVALTDDGWKEICEDCHADLKLGRRNNV